MTGLPELRLGLFGARCDSGGLAAQTFEYYRWLKPHKTLVVDISELNGQPTYPGRYDSRDTTFVKGIPDRKRIEWFLKGLDIVMTVETPYNYYLFEAARKLGVKIIHIYNYEFLDYLQDLTLPTPNMLLSPSPWHNDEVRELSKQLGIVWKYLPVPVNRSLFPYRPRTQARSFLHIAGHHAYADRNGTKLVLEAIPYVKQNVSFTIRSQEPMPKVSDPRVTIICEDKINNFDLYNDESVLLLPRRYGGLSLQLNEALSCGMIPIMIGCEPVDELLSPTWLIDPIMEKIIYTRAEFPSYTCDPKELAAKIDFFATRPGGVIRDWSAHASALARWIDWETMLREYRDTLERCWKL